MMDNFIIWWIYLTYFGIIQIYGYGFSNNFVEIDLRYGIVKGYSPFISFVSTPTTTRDRTCNGQAVIKMNFSGPYKGAKLLLDYGESPRLWTLDISDSPTGDGFGGDNGTTSNNAETQIHNRQLRIYGNSLPGYMEASTNGGNLMKVVDNFVKKGSKVSLDISDERVEWIQGRKRDYMESEFLFTVSGQPTVFGTVEQDIFVGFNRVVRAPHRYGSGLCRVTISLYEPGKDCERGTHSCHKDAICLSSRRSYKCRCKEGFYGNGKICVDEDECEYDNGGCVHSCDNSPGNYTCSCMLGFALAPDRHNCIDVNECFEERGGCAHQCVNTMGSFQCKCNAGFGLHSDGKTCILGTWCQKMLGCSHHCKSTPHGLTCACRDGFRIHSDGKMCVETCAVGNGGCQHKCQDTPDGPVCSCAARYILQDNKKTCIASCGVNRGGCERKCLDTKAGPKCSCPRGYELHQDGRSCLDINECDSDNGHCSHTCVNTHGSYECVCPDGFKVNADQRSCQDIDECLVNRSCDHICVNTLGSFQCTCREGFEKYGHTHCADVNECSMDNGGCQQVCQNTHGSFQCSCRKGYKLHTNQKDCISASTCISLKVPAKSSMSCQTASGGEKQCSLTCNNRARFSVPMEQQQYDLTCGPSSDYKWTFEKDNMTMPMCSEKAFPPSFKRKAAFVFVMDRKCHFHKSAVQYLMGNLTQVLNEQKKFKCTKKCHVNYMDMKCGSRRKKFQRHIRGTHKSLITAEFELQMNSKKPSAHCNSDCMTKRTQRKLRKAFKSLKRSIKREKFYVKFEGHQYEVLKRSFKPEKSIEVACRPGNVLINKMCVACSIGTYYDGVSEKCELCPGGTYQDQEGKLSCKECPHRQPGMGVTGAKNTDECTELCEPGFYSENGSKPCRPCGIGTYQPEYGRTSCVPCGTGVRTRSLATTNFQGCEVTENCLAGHYYNINEHKCLKCPIGTYQSKPGYNFCNSCPGDTTTDQDSSTSSEDCKDRSCRWYQGRYQGVIETPNYPGNYPVNMKCTWKIKPEKRRRILIIIPEIYVREDDKCGDVLVMRKSKSPYSLTTFETCKSRDKPIAFTARSKKLWIQFKSDANNTAAGFSIPFVTYNEEYQSLIDDIVGDGRLYNSYHQQQIFKDRRLLDVLLEVIAEPPTYFKYANVSHKMFPESFFKLLTPKVRRFFTT